MIELITAVEWANSPDIRKEVYNFRHKVFIQKLGWEIGSIDQLEFDKYDGLLPVYLLARDVDKDIKALMRLLPTDGPYMLKNTFPELLGNKAAPVDKKIWEISRFAFDPGGFGSESISKFTNIAGEMFCALGEFGLERGISQVVAVYDYRITPILNKLNCKPLWIGNPKRTGRGLAVAASFEVSQTKLNQLRITIGNSTPLLTKIFEGKKAA